MLRLAAPVRVARRSFFSSASEVQNFTLKRVLPHPPQLLLKIVSDVEAYPHFVPYLKKSTITGTDSVGRPSSAVLKVGYNVFEESFESKIQCIDNSIIAEVVNDSQQLFNTLHTTWTIEEVDGRSDKCVVDFKLQFAFVNPVYNAVWKSFGPTLASITVKAFQDRAKQLESLKQVEA